MFLHRIIANLFRHPLRRTRAVRFAESLEDRTLLSGLNLSAAGAVSISGGAENNSFEISFDSGTNIYTINDASPTASNFTASGLSGAFAAIVTGLGTTTVSFSATDVDALVLADPGPATALNMITVNGNNGDDTVTINSIRAGGEGLTINNNAGSDTVNINADLGSVGSRISRGIVNIQGDAINLNGSVFTNNTAVSLGGPVTLGANSTIDTIASGVTFSSTVEGGQDLSIIGGAVQMNGAVGAGTALSSISLNGTSVLTQGVRATDAISISADSYSQVGALDGDGTAALTLVRRTAGAQLFNADSLPFVSNSFSSVTIGSALTTTLTISSDGDNVVATGSFGFGSELTLIGGTVLLNDHIDTGANPLNIQAENQISFNGIAAAVGTGAVTLSKTTPGGTLSITGTLGKSTSPNFWGSNSLTVNGLGSTVSFGGGIGGSLTSFSASADVLNFNHPSAPSAVGNVQLNATTVNLNGGVQSTSGSVQVNATDIILNRSATFLAATNIGLAGNITGSGTQNLVIRGNNAAPGLIFMGNVTGVNNFTVGALGANIPVNVQLRSVSAGTILVYGNNISLFADAFAGPGTLQTTVGNLHLRGNVTLMDDVDMISTSAAPRFVRVDGTVTGFNGSEDLSVDAGLKAAVFAGVVSNINNLSVTSQAPITINSDISVGNDFLWNNGTGSFVVNTGRTISAGNNLTIIAGSFNNKGTVAAGGILTTP